jgi:hypothetical protein
MEKYIKIQMQSDNQQLSVCPLKSTAGGFVATLLEKPHELLNIQKSSLDALCEMRTNASLGNDQANAK